MKSHILAMTDNLLWSRSGTVWASWALQPLPYGYRAVEDKQEVRNAHRALLRSLRGEALLQSVAVGMDPAGVVDRMMSGLDMQTHPEWAKECLAALDTLDDLAPGERAYFLHVPLRENKFVDGVTESVRAGLANAKDLLQLPRLGLPAGVVQRYLDRAERLRSTLPAQFHARAITPAHHVWLAAHARDRGRFMDLDMPSFPDEATGVEHSASSFGQVLLDEGGQTDVERRTVRNLNPATRRFLKVADGEDPENASYQALLALSDVPAGGMVFPGSEFLGRIDESGLDVDIGVRLTVRTSEEVAARNRRAVSRLNEQYEQRAGEMSTGTHELDRAADELTEYQRVLAEDKNEVDIQATIVFGVGAPTSERALESARHLSGFFRDMDFRVTHPVGQQRALWEAMNPGTPAGAIIREFAQTTTSSGLAAAVPVSSIGLGDTAGLLFAKNISAAGRPGVVLVDLMSAMGAKHEASASIALVGDLGSGKSTGMKVIAAGALDRGAQIVAIDRTGRGEWVRLAHALADPVVVSIASPEWSLDPLRVHGPEAGARITQSLLTTLVGIEPTSEQGVLVSEILQGSYLREHGITGLGEMIAHLRGTCELAGALPLAQLLDVFATKDFGRVLFDADLPALDLSSRAIVFHTHGLELPDRSELEHGHLFAHLTLEKRFGRALYALMAGMARQICFRDPNELAAFFVDETHHLTASTEGVRELTDFVRDGRKHGAAVVMGSHDPATDFGNETLQGLIGMRVLMRHRSKDLAARGLRFLGLDAEDTALIKLVTEHTSPAMGDGVPLHRRGEGLLRDFAGRVGRVQILLPSRDDRREAVRTTPGLAPVEPAA